ncbi:pentatricopeptide repeat-containing protein chloroplastic-like [Gossypium australe]|uniref:Pentatricopeptide repeat-containing protein chloroplastic-like n=1 Tax=Gossypium australe TaxID=47621 RepID=A0A5B6VZR1_9ROSI|nr:pentatricopeptide repeat-containing protein chloroplastic-like [Gossypium australe]
MGYLYAAGGTLNNKTPEAAYEFIEEMSLNNYQWQVMKTKPMKTDVDAVAMLSSQVEALNKKINSLYFSTQRMSKSIIWVIILDFKITPIVIYRLEELSKFLLGWSRKLKSTTSSKLSTTLSAREKAET